jgi:serine/threonine protein kinase
MPYDSSVPQPTPPNYQRTTGGDHLRWQPPTPQHLQEMLPAYEVLSIIGQGGMGAVYKGRQKSLDRIIAIKILPPEAGAGDMQFIERFKNEARTMAKMNHPAIVHVYDFGETCEGQLYIVMEFIDGTDVAKMIQSQGKLPEDYALSITAHVCDALGYAHTHGVVHRDIKPANILINMEGQVKVADFGLAKATDPKAMGLTQTNMTMGTPDFVSPEALTPGVVLDGRADLYAVGVMLYNMLTGSIPRGAFRMPSITLQTDARFDKIILKAMEMDRANRYQTALDLRRDLDVILTAPTAKTSGQPLPAQQAALPQKPVGKSPSAPQQRPAAGAATPGRTAPAASKPAATPTTTPAKKSNSGVIYGIAAAVVVIAGGAFMFAGGGKKPAPAPKTVAEKKPEPKKPESKPITPPPAADKPKPVETKPAPAPATVAAGKEKWVDGLAQWFGGTQTHKSFVLDQSNGSAHVGSYSTLTPVPPSATPFRDQVARVRWLPNESNSSLNLYLRRSLDAAGKEVSYRANLNPKADAWTVRLGCTAPGKASQAFGDYKLPADFKADATHTMELRIVGDLLTIWMDGNKIGERRDSQIANGHPAFGAQKVTVASFEYANLDPGAPAPAVPTASTTKPGDVLTFGGHRYQLVLEKRGWDAAKAQAEALGGHLATITSKEERDWLLKNVVVPMGTDSHVYLGGTKPKSTGVWTWVTGEPVDLDLWGGKGPDGNGPVLTFQSGNKQWDDVGTSSAYTFLVEWDGDAPAKPAPAASAAPTPAVAPAMPAEPSAPAPTAPASPPDPRLAQLAAGFKARLETDALQPFATALAALNTSYLANGVSRARTAAKAKGSLVEVTALDDEKAAIEKGRGVPDEDDADTSEALKTLRGTYRTAYAKLAAERDARAAPLYESVCECVGCLHRRSDPGGQDRGRPQSAGVPRRYRLAKAWFQSHRTASHRKGHAILSYPCRGNQTSRACSEDERA